MMTAAEARDLLLLEWESRQRARRKAEEPRYDWYGPPCGCPETREDGSCPLHHRARENQRPPTDPDWLVWLCLAGRGWGKALALDMPIPTPSGWSTMGELAVGDEVFDEQGQVCRVTFATEVQIGRTCYEVVFSDGTKIVADSEHRWLTMDKAARKAHGRAANPTIHEAVRTTEEIRSSLRVHGGREVNHSVRVTAPLDLSDAELPIDPYVLGVWLGDGDSAGATLTCSDHDCELLEILAARDCRVVEHPAGRQGTTGRYGIGGEVQVVDLGTGRFASNGSLHSKLKKAGLVRNKHIPSLYLRGSIRQRKDLLAGLMDTDGSVCPGGHVEFMSTKQELSDGVRELATSLGHKPTLYEERATLDGKDCGPRYRVSWTPHEPVFRLRRKLDRQHCGKSQSCRNFRRYIVAVNPVPSVAVRCITVDSPSHLFLCSRAMIPTHNTRTGTEWIIQRAKDGPENGRYALVGQTAKDVREVMVLGESGILAKSPPWFRPEYNKTHGVLTWPNGAKAFCFSSEEPGQLRGPQFHDALCDELAKWSYVEECWSNLKLALRLGAGVGHTPRVVVTTTPLPLPLIKRLLEDTFRTRVSRGSTFDNAANLAESYIADVKAQYEGTRLGQQELYAEILDDTPGALWKHDWIERDRVNPEDVPELVRIVVAIDPPAADPKFKVYDEDKRAEAGITVGGIGEDGHRYLLEDLSMSGSPTEWAEVAIEAYRRHRADLIVAEVNNGGAMIEAVLRSVDQSIPYKQLWASRGKQTRAEPIATQYERKEIHHVGRFQVLESQLCSWVQGGKSPDRLDSLVWLMTELMEAMPATYGGPLFPDFRG